MKSEDVAAEVVAALRAARRQAKVTQVELAKRSGISRGHISQIETGQREPRLSTLMRYASAIGARIDFEVGEES